MTDLRYHVLNERHELVEAADVGEWGRFFQSGDRRVGKDEIGDAEVSTVFLGIDHGWGDKHLWFETMIFGGEHDQASWRYETWDEAIVGHRRVVTALREDRNPDDD